MQTDFYLLIFLVGTVMVHIHASADTLKQYLRFANFVQLKLDKILVFVRICLEFFFPAEAALDSAIQIPRFGRWIIGGQLLQFKLQ